MFRQAFQIELSTFLLSWEGFKKFLLFGLFTLGIFGGPEKDREICFWWSSFYSLEVDGWGVAGSSGEVARDPVGVLPSASSFFSAFNILLRWVSSLLMAAPRLRSISLEVEMPNFVATSRMVLGLYFSPKRFLLFFSKPCQSMYPIARTLLNSSALPSSSRSSSAQVGTLVEGRGVACTDGRLPPGSSRLPFQPAAHNIPLPGVSTSPFLPKSL